MVSWNNRNRKSWRKKVKDVAMSPTGGEASAQDSQLSLLTKEGADDPVSPVHQASALGPKEVQEANALIDQLKKLLSQ